MHSHAECMRIYTRATICTTVTISVYMYVCMPACMSGCMHAYMPTCMCAEGYVDMSVGGSAARCVCVCVCVGRSAGVCARGRVGW